MRCPTRVRDTGEALELGVANLAIKFGGLKESRIDCYIGPAPADVGPELLVEKLFDNTRVIMARQGHPLGQAREAGAPS